LDKIQVWPGTAGPRRDWWSGEQPREADIENCLVR